MSNLITIPVLLLLSFFSYLFFLWKYLRDDYDTNKIFTFGIATYFAFMLGLFIGTVVKEIWFWTALLAYGMMFIFMIRKNHFKVIEAIEASTPGFVITYVLILIYGLLRNEGFETIVLSVTSLLLLAIFFILKKNYKRFNWYRSGRLGFASMVVLGLLFLIRAIASVLDFGSISLIGVVGFIPSAILSFFSFFTVYNLSQRR